MLAEELQSDDCVARILERFDAIMNYDHQQSTYTELLAKRILAWRRRKINEAQVVKLSKAAAQPYPQCHSSLVGSA
jgi:hypothetical protein